METTIMDVDVQELATKESNMEEQHLLQLRQHTPQKPRPEIGLATLPTELVDSIFGYVAIPQSICPFLLSRRLHDSAARALYRDLRIEVCSSTRLDDGSNLPYMIKRAASEPPERRLHVSGIVAPKLHRVRSLIEAHVASLTENAEEKQGTQLISSSLLETPRSISAALFTDEFIEELARHRIFVDNAFVKNLGLELGTSMWGGWLDKILQKALDTKSLACDVIPGMWGNEMSGWQAVTFDTELMDFRVDERYLSSYSMRNLHTLCLRGFHGYHLDLDLSTLPNLRTLKTLNVEIREQVGSNGITELEHRHTKAPRYAASAYGISTSSNLDSFRNIQTFRSVILPPATVHTKHHIKVYLANLRQSAATLTNLELILLGRWDFDFNPHAVFTKPFRALTTLRLPSAQLVHLTSLNPDIGVEPSTIKRIELVVFENLPGLFFEHVLKDIVSHTVSHVKPYFPNLALLKITIADTVEKDVCRDIKGFLRMMAHVVKRGAFSDHKLIQRVSGSCRLGSFELDNGLVLDYYDLMKHMARHDVNWVWPACS